MTVSPLRFFTTRPSPGDLVAGISVALVVIPQSLAYAEIAGLPPKVGLITATIPLLVAAPLLSCPWLQTGPVAVTSLLTFAALSTLAEVGGADYVGLASLLALMVGALRLTMGLLGLGTITNLLRPPVVLGFTTGAATLILSTQIPRALGSDTPDYGVLRRAGWALIHPSTWHWPSILMAVLAAGIVVGGRYAHKLFPAVLAAVIVCLGLSHLMNFDGAVIGDLPDGFISLSLDLPWSKLGELLIPALVIAVVGFAEPASISLKYMGDAGRTWDASRELRASGFANLASSLVGGYPVGGSFSRSALNKLAGATSGWSVFITGAIVITFLPFVAILERLPRATLAAIIMVAIVRLIQIRSIVELVRFDRVAGGVAVLTMAATLATAPHVERGVLVGVVAGLAASRFERTAAIKASNVR